MNDQLLSLLPATYRVSDARADGGNGFLEALLRLVGSQVEELQADLDQLYDDLFIETCEPWVVPYIGELLGVVPGHAVSGVSETTRARVAHAIALRRRKGTAAILEELANDVTGWPARAVEMFETLATTQYLNHLRTERPAFVSLRGASTLERLGGPFDAAAHTVEARWITSGRGRFNVPNVAIFLWPVVDLGFTDVEPIGLGDSRFRFHPLGLDVPLMTSPVPERAISSLALPLNVPLPISRRALHDHLPVTADGDSPFYGDIASILVEVAGNAVPAQQVIACALDDDPATAGAWQNVAEVGADQVAIDPQRGRLVLGTDFAGGDVIVSFHQVTGGPVGGGSYSRPQRPLAGRTPTIVSRADPLAANQTIGAGLAAVGGAGLVVIDDSRTYAESVTVTVPADQELELRSSDTRFPVLSLPAAGAVFDCEDGASVVLDGLLVTGGPVIVIGRPRHVEVRHCTLVPGLAVDSAGAPTAPEEASITIESDADSVPEVTILGSITGPVLVPPGCPLAITDSIVTGGEPEADGLPAVVGVAVSPPLQPLPALGSAPNQLLLLVGDDPPEEVDIGTPADLAALATGLTAPNRAGVVAGDRIVVVGRDRVPVSVRAVSGDGTLAILGLDADDVARSATVGVSRPGPLALSSPTPRLGIRTGAGPLAVVDLGSVPADLPAAATALQAAIRSLSPAAVHTDALVIVVDDALGVVPGTPGQVLAAGPAPDDRTTVVELGLASPLAAVASDGAGAMGPVLTAERSTFLGRVTVDVAALASDCIFSAPLVARRAQEGCARYSYLAPGSRPPRRHHCLPSETCEPVLIFASTRYGDADFATLYPLDAGAAIRRGASNGSEMGVFSRLQHRQRENNLRFDLDAFLRFGLEAGLLDGR